MCELHQSPSIHPHWIHHIFATSISEKVLSLLLSKANTSCVLKISVPPYHLKTWFSISPSFCSFPPHPFILLNQQTFSGILQPQNNLFISCFPFSSHALLSLSISGIFWTRNLHSQPLTHYFPFVPQLGFCSHYCAIKAALLMSSNNFNSGRIWGLLRTFLLALNQWFTNVRVCIKMIMVLIKIKKKEKTILDFSGEILTLHNE